MDVSFGFPFCLFYLLSTGFIKDGDANSCGCKSLRPCYENMIRDLQHGDEVFCIEQAAIGASTVEIYLQAIQRYCKDYVTLKDGGLTSEGRTLHQVTIAEAETESRKQQNGKKPTILVDAGQEAGLDTVSFALYFIQQLVACEDFSEMISKAKWVIIPSANPDGLEYAKDESEWRKNMVSFSDKPGFGVDISRNFDYKFDSCPANKEVFSPSYPGPSPLSEIESRHISDVIDRLAEDIEAYVSIRRDGHAVLYPYAYDDLADDKLSMQTADLIAARVNQRTGSIRVFTNSSIYKENGNKRCGHSVDYAFSKGIKIALELRAFHKEELAITLKFQNVPRGYDATLRNGYFIALREVFNAVVNKPAAKL